MDYFNILAWNVRGAASSDFRRVFVNLVGRHKPNLVLLTKTRVGGDRAEQIISNLGYQAWFKVDPMGYAGGLWLLWDSSQIKLTVHGNTFQEIHTSAEVCGCPSVFISFVYASPVRARRKIL